MKRIALLIGMAFATEGYIPPYTDDDKFDDSDGVLDELINGKKPR